MHTAERVREARRRHFDRDFVCELRPPERTPGLVSRGRGWPGARVGSVADSQLTLGQWSFGVSDNQTGRHSNIGMIIAAVPEHNVFQMAADVGQGWNRIGWFETRHGADTAVALIDRFGASREHARIGGETAGSGMGGDHPGVEWVTSLNEDDARPFTERLSALGTARLWVVPSVDGETFALLNPNSEDQVLGYFDDEACADIAVYMVDMIIAASA